MSRTNGILGMIALGLFSLSSDLSAQITYPTSGPGGNDLFVTAQGIQHLVANGGGAGSAVLQDTATRILQITDPNNISLTYALAPPTLPATVFSYGTNWLPLSCSATTFAELTGNFTYEITGDNQSVSFQADKNFLHTNTAISRADEPQEHLFANLYSEQYLEAIPPGNFLECNIPFTVADPNGIGAFTASASTTFSTGIATGNTTLRWGVFNDANVDGRPDGAPIILDLRAANTSASFSLGLPNGSYVIVLRYDAWSRLDSSFPICNSEDEVTVFESAQVECTAEVSLTSL